MIEYFTKNVPGSDVALSNDDPNMLLIGTSLPDTVRLPTSLGGHHVRCLSQHVGPCPLAKCGQTHKTLVLEGGVSVAECPTNGFLWFRTPTEKG